MVASCSTTPALTHKDDFLGPVRLTILVFRSLGVAPVILFLRSSERVTPKQNLMDTEPLRKTAKDIVSTGN